MKPAARRDEGGSTVVRLASMQEVEVERSCGSRITRTWTLLSPSLLPLATTITRLLFPDSVGLDLIYCWLSILVLAFGDRRFPKTGLASPGRRFNNPPLALLPRCSMLTSLASGWWRRHYAQLLPVYSLRNPLLRPWLGFQSY